jgi:hypothetical protein
MKTKFSNELYVPVINIVLSFLSIYLSIYLWLYSPLLDLGRLLNSLIFYTVGSTSWTGDRPFAKPPPTHRTTQTQNKNTQSSMLRVGFAPTIPVFERAKAVYALGHAATVIGLLQFHKYEISRGAVSLRKYSAAIELEKIPTHYHFVHHKIPHEHTWERTRHAAGGIRRHNS